MGGLIPASVGYHARRQAEQERKANADKRDIMQDLANAQGIDLSTKEMQDDLGVKNAAIRKLHQELGINSDDIPISDFHLITRMHYFARADEKWIEREIDHILFIQADVTLNINPNEIDEIKWVNQNELESMINDERIPIATCCRCMW